MSQPQDPATTSCLTDLQFLDQPRKIRPLDTENFCRLGSVAVGGLQRIGDECPAEQIIGFLERGTHIDINWGMGVFQREGIRSQLITIGQNDGPLHRVFQLECNLTPNHPKYSTLNHNHEP